MEDKMNLELRKIQIRDVVFDDVSKIENNVLHLKKSSLIELIKEDKRIKEVDFDIAKPGQSVRILPVKDVIEPRAKLNGEIFPGIFKEHMEESGSGITYVLSGCAVVTTGPIVGFQ